MGRGQAGFSGRYNLENKRSRQTVVVKDLFQKVEGLCSRETQIQTKSANTSILCRVFKPSSVLANVGDWGQSPDVQTEASAQDLPQGGWGKYSLDRHPGDTPQHAQPLHSHSFYTPTR